MNTIADDDVILGALMRRVLLGNDGAWVYVKVEPDNLTLDVAHFDITEVEREAIRRVHLCYEVNA